MRRGSKKRVGAKRETVNEFGEVKHAFAISLLCEAVKLSENDRELWLIDKIAGLQAHVAMAAQRGAKVTSRRRRRAA